MFILAKLCGYRHCSRALPALCDSRRLPKGPSFQPYHDNDSPTAAAVARNAVPRTPSDTVPGRIHTIDRIVAHLCEQVRVAAGEANRILAGPPPSHRVLIPCAKGDIGRDFQAASAIFLTRSRACERCARRRSQHRRSKTQTRVFGRAAARWIAHRFRRTCALVYSQAAPCVCIDALQLLASTKDHHVSEFSCVQVRQLKRTPYSFGARSRGAPQADRTRTTSSPSKISKYTWHLVFGSKSRRSRGLRFVG
jgi:hypothetical protein